MLACLLAKLTLGSIGAVSAFSVGVVFNPKWSIAIGCIKVRQKSRDQRLIISANHEIISMTNFATLPLDEEASVSGDLGLVGRRLSPTFSSQYLKQVCISI